MGTDSAGRSRETHLDLGEDLGVDTPQSGRASGWMYPDPKRGSGGYPLVSGWDLWGTYPSPERDSGSVYPGPGS